MRNLLKVFTVSLMLVPLLRAQDKPAQNQSEAAKHTTAMRLKVRDFIRTST